MKKTLLIFFIILTTLAPVLAFSGSAGADSVTIKSNKATDILIAKHASLPVLANAVLNKKTGYSSPDSTTISPSPNGQLTSNYLTNDHSQITNDQTSTFSQSASSQSLVTSHQSPNDHSTTSQSTNNQFLINHFLMTNS
ncbi:hypothetical protein C9994_13530 [Marivirga lumbricoides]|uniref:Uncharacterized protein n=1 Tax=Marivirga lumbricoides TaxID=1046115 RepID=A0A2T4DGG4_9BACT|nr:hypothetical protein C9994_13530 [Marivirga lumbricoides]